MHNYVRINNNKKKIEFLFRYSDYLAGWRLVCSIGDCGVLFLGRAGRLQSPHQSPTVFPSKGRVLLHPLKKEPHTLFDKKLRNYAVV